MDRVWGVQLNWREGGSTSNTWHSIVLSHHRTDRGAANRRDMLRKAFKDAGLDKQYEVYVIPVHLEE